MAVGCVVWEPPDGSTRRASMLGRDKIHRHSLRSEPRAPREARLHLPRLRHLLASHRSQARAALGFSARDPATLACIVVAKRDALEWRTICVRGEHRRNHRWRASPPSLWWCAWTVAAWEAGKKQGQDGWLDDHNYYRCLHGADPVGWDYTLESQAQAVANSMPHGALGLVQRWHAGGREPRHGHGHVHLRRLLVLYNQNCATHYWYEEVECWGFGDDGWKSPTCTIGHLTAMIWKKTTKIGCASNGNYFVCQYGAEPPNFNWLVPHE